MIKLRMLFRSLLRRDYVNVLITLWQALQNLNFNITEKLSFLWQVMKKFSWKYLIILLYSEIALTVPPRICWIWMTPLVRQLLRKYYDTECVFYVQEGKKIYW